MAKYKVYYSGFYYCEADSTDEAMECRDEAVYEEEEITSVEEVDEFIVRFEED